MARSIGGGFLGWEVLNGTEGTDLHLW
uniref:Uncharacterized protein n=1 Tax=Anguilla anguilla TaxID=7936 RepID=A0A0E9U9N9_ANGAN